MPGNGEGIDGLDQTWKIVSNVIVLLFYQLDHEGGSGASASGCYFPWPCGIFGPIMGTVFGGSFGAAMGPAGMTALSPRPQPGQMPSTIRTAKGNQSKRFIHSLLASSNPSFER
jgi:hypothetical protein